jgi:hypothetical protein
VGTRASRIVALLTAAALAAGCADDEPDQIGADTDGAETAATTEPAEPEEPEDPFAIPDEIDEEYTQRVLDELIPPLNEADRAELEDAPTSFLSDETMATYRAMYDVSASAEMLTYLSQRVATEDEVAAYREQLAELGEIRWVVDEVGDADDTCIPFGFTYDYSASDEINTGIGALVRSIDTRDPEGINPTPWALGFAGHPDVIEQSLDTICGATLEAREELLEESGQETTNEEDDGSDDEDGS